MIALEIRKLPDGGYIVSPVAYRYEHGVMHSPLFACSRLDDALGFIQDKMEPVEE